MKTKEYKTCDKCCYDILDNEGDIMEHECNERYCPKCLGKVEVEKEKEIEYPFVCLECDENFYEFETKTK